LKLAAFDGRLERRPKHATGTQCVCDCVARDGLALRCSHERHDLGCLRLGSLSGFTRLSLSVVLSLDGLAVSSATSTVDVSRVDRPLVRLTEPTGGQHHIAGRATPATP
jgi:hypothetical protein